MKKQGIYLAILPALVICSGGLGTSCSNNDPQISAYQARLAALQAQMATMTGVNTNMSTVTSTQSQTVTAVSTVTATSASTATTTIK